MSWQWRIMQNLIRNWLVISKLTWEIWRIMTWAVKSVKNVQFHELLLHKVYNVWAKKVQRSYISWHWREMQNLKENWLVVWKMTWEFWQILLEHPKNLRIGNVMGYFYPKQKMYELKICRGVMRHDNKNDAKFEE